MRPGMHELFAAATAEAARSLDDATRHDDRPYLREADLDRAFVDALRQHTVERVDARRQRWIPGWDPQPGQIDVLVERTTRETARLRFTAELKWCNDNKVFEALWDVVKMTSATRIPGVEAAYLVYGAPQRYWDRPVECARELFVIPSSKESIISVPQLIDQHLAWWTKYILGDSRGRFGEAPAATALELVAAVDLSVAGKAWQIRTVAAKPVGETVVEFKNGVPLLFP
jgi:hypothetical protein